MVKEPPKIKDLGVKLNTKYGRFLSEVKKAMEIEVETSENTIKLNKLLLKVLNAEIRAEEKKLKRPLGIARLIPGKCIACGARCQSSCAKDAVEMNEAGEPIILVDKCIGCRKCIRICPAEALEIYFTPEQQKILDEIAARSGKKAPAPAEEVGGEEEALLAKLKEYRGVWVFVEQTEGEPAVRQRITGRKVGRNDPCPCGSGKKYKKCCGQSGN